MGILDQLRVGKRTHSLLNSVNSWAFASPWQEGDLTQVALSDIFGVDMVDRFPMTREEAMRVPAVSKARNLLVSTIAKFPLTAMDSRTLDAEGYPLPSKAQPAWMSRTNSNVPPYERMAWTVDDLIFYGYALWQVTRGGTADTEGRRPILDAAYVPRSEWELDEDGRILIDGAPMNALDVILFNSPFEGLLTLAADTLRGARDLEAAWFGRARNPIPLIELHGEEDSELSKTEIKDVVDAWSKARRSKDGGIGYTPHGLALRVHGEVKADLMVEGRNAVRTDVGSFLNVRASMLDGTAGVDSLTYTTTKGERNAFYEFDLPFWTDPIAARLSMDDVVARSTYSAFDMYNSLNTPASTGPALED